MTPPKQPPIYTNQFQLLVQFFLGLMEHSLVVIMQNTLAQMTMLMFMTIHMLALQLI